MGVLKKRSLIYYNLVVYLQKIIVMKERKKSHHKHFTFSKSKDLTSKLKMFTPPRAQMYSTAVLRVSLRL